MAKTQNDSVTLCTLSLYASIFLSLLFLEEVYFKIFFYFKKACNLTDGTNFFPKAFLVSSRKFIQKY